MTIKILFIIAFLICEILAALNVTLPPVSSGDPRTINLVPLGLVFFAASLLV